MKNLVFGLILISLLISCSSVETDTELFKKGKTLVEQKNILEAVAAYEQLIKEYPQSSFADSTLYNLASIYQYSMVPNLQEKLSLQKAALYFKRIFDEYPERDLAPAGLFMCGYIQANDLKDYEAAKKTYNLFLEKYPDTEFAVSAKAELDNMGLAPEEILKKNIAREK
jgi:TolA-binding protein